MTSFAARRLILQTARAVPALVRLALPIVAVQVGMVSMGVVDTLMVGRVSPTALAAVALGNLYFFGLALFGVGVLMGLDPVIAQAVGAGDREAVSRGLQRGLVLATLLAIPSSALLLAAEPVLGALGQPAEVVPLAGGYARRVLPGTLPFFAFVVWRQTLQAMDRVTPIVVTILVTNLVNVLLNWAWVHGNLGFPAMGALGSAWATTVSRWLMGLGVLALAWRALGPHLHPVRPGLLEREPLLRMLRVGLPVGVQLQLESGAFTTVGLLMGWLGTVPVAAHQVAFNLAALTFMVPLGISAATAVRVGHAVGRGKPRAARACAAAGMIMGGGFMVLTACAFMLAPRQLAGLYTDDGHVLALAASLIPIAGVFQVFDGVQAVAAGVLRGLADTRVPMLSALAGFWILGLPLGAILAFGLGMGAPGLWWGLAAGLAAVAVFLVARVRIQLRRGVRRLVI